MPVYRVAVISTPQAAAGAAFYDFQTAGRRAFWREKRTSTLVGINSSIGTVLANNTPVPTTSATPQATESGDAAATCKLDTAWSTAPTIAGSPNWLETVDIGPSQGQILIETYPLDGQGKFTVAQNTFVVAWNFGTLAGDKLAVTFIYEE